MLTPDGPSTGTGGLLILGRGRVSRALVAAARSAGLGAVVGSGRAAREGTLPDVAGGPPLVLLAVPDDALDALAAPVASALLQAGGARALLHLSGARDASALAAARPSGIPIGSFHPLQTFAGDADPALFRGIAVAIDGDAGALAEARALANRLGAHVLEIRGPARAAWHLGASLSANGLVALVGAGVALLRGAGLGERDALAALAPLLRRSLENALDIGPRLALTGPVARGDEATIARHRETVARLSPERVALFEALVSEQRRVRAES